MPPRAWRENPNSCAQDNTENGIAEESTVQFPSRCGFGADAFRLSDVSEYLAPDGNRYRVERVAPSSTTRERHTSQSVSDSPSPASAQSVADRRRFAQVPHDPTPPITSPIRRHAHHNFARISASEVENDGAPKEAFALPTRVRSGPEFLGSDFDNTSSIDPFRQIHRPPTRQMWEGLELDSPKLDLSPEYQQILSPNRRERLNPGLNGSTTSTSVHVQTQSNLSIPHSVANGIDLRTPVLVVNSEASTTSGESLILESETLGETLILESDVALSLTAQSDFHSSSMRVFSNTVTDDIRFYFVTEFQGNRTAQCFRLQRRDAELVPLYGYHPARIRIIGIREILRRQNRLTRNPNAPRPDDEGLLPSLPRFPVGSARLSGTP